MLGLCFPIVMEKYKSYKGLSLWTIRYNFREISYETRNQITQREART